MPLTFPTNPTLGRIYSSGSSPTYRWNGTFWTVVQPSASFAVTASTALSASFSISASTSISSSFTTTASLSSFRNPTQFVWNQGSASITTQGAVLSGSAFENGNYNGVTLTPNAGFNTGISYINLPTFDWNKDFRISSQFFTTDNGPSTGDYMNIVMGGASPSSILRTAPSGGLSLSVDDYDGFATGRGFTLWDNNVLLNSVPVIAATPILGNWYNISIEVRTNRQNTRNIYVWHNSYMILGYTHNWTPAGSYLGLSAFTGGAFALHAFRYLTLEYI
jgi:hypothetical protein